MIRTEARNASLNDLAVLLQDQHARQLDVVAPATSVRSINGRLHIANTAEPVITPDGVTPVAGVYTPTEICDEGLAEKLGISRAYLRRLRNERTDLLDHNINALLHGQKVNRGGVTQTVHEPDPRSFLIRCFRGDDGPGLARAFLSDAYRPIDNLDVLMSALSGAREAAQSSGQDIKVVSCDLSERAMRVKILAPGIAALAPTLFAGYQSPFRTPALNEARLFDGGRDLGTTPDGSPLVFAGFLLSNSETGNGAYSLRPYLEALICNNGMTLQRNVIKAVHLGSRLDDGVIDWSADTKRKMIELVQAKTADAVRTFLSQSFLDKVVAEIEAQAGVELTQPAKAVEVLGKKLQFSKEETAGILDHFTRGGQMTAGGYLNAVTSYAQTVASPDRAGELEATAMQALTAAASLNRELVSS